jgi:DNA-directed RNA polymerase II subunit RPB2
MESISWKLIDTYFKDNVNNLVAHHLESYNDFFGKGINNIFKENNPVRFIEREDKLSKNKENRNECLLYLGGKDGSKIYFGKPIIYDDDKVHYMYPNDARLRNMTYGITIHYDVDVDFIYFVGEEKREKSITLEKIYLGRFPIMLQSNLCILKSLKPDVRFNMGECRNDYGGYFIIDGKEKVIVSQEKFANNMLYVRKNKDDNEFNYSSEIRSVSEDASKPMRTTAVRMVAPTSNYSNGQLVVEIPNVRKEIPLFIVMRALGIVSDKNIIEVCLLDMEKYKSYVDLFIPSIHDANKIFNQETALKFIASFTKRETTTGVLEILTNYLLPHVGELNFLDKAYFIGYMTNKLLRVFTGEDKPTDRDNYLFKRVELSGTLIYDLFREYFLIQNRNISQKIDQEYYYHKGKYEDDNENNESDKTDQYKENFTNLIENNYKEYFKERIVEDGFRKAFKGNWGSQTYTKRLGVVQDLNRLSWFTHISHLRKTNLPMESSAKVVGPRHLNGSQYGYLDFVDTPDGANIGFHKHLSITTAITSGFSSFPIIKWLRANTPMKIIQECSPIYLANNSKIIVNGNWIGVIDNPIEIVKTMKLFRRNGIFPPHMSISFDFKREEIHIYTDSGRLTRPIYYIENQKVSFERNEVEKLFIDGDITWQQIVSGFKEKNDVNYSIKNNKIYELIELYPELKDVKTTQEMDKILEKYKSVVDYIDVAEEETALFATQLDQVKRNKYYTHLEIDPSLILGVMGNSVIYPEHNPIARDVFSCSQSRQAVSVYHSNYQMRIDKMGVILNYGETPLVKSRYLKYINNEEQPYGVNAIVAIMSYTGYNVEDAILINEGSIARGIFRTTYYSMYESREESSKIAKTNVNSVFTDVMNSKKKIVGIKDGYDYSYLDEYGMIRENTPLNDKIMLIGQVTSSINDPDVGTDVSTKPKKGQLGFVDKAFITEGEEGTKLAKIRVREERLPALGDKMASRSGQKGTLGLIIPEEDMPFAEDGIRPDLIINPHAIPSRMTIGQLVETIYGKVCAYYGGAGDCTAFAIKGSNAEIYGHNLTNAGFHSSGNQILYNGYTGEQLQANIYIGPTYYMRLKHMVKDKINYRARGPRTVLTRQTVQGRANDGGLRIGEMERDGILAHGMSYFLNESFMIRGDEYYIAICNKTGCISIYNSSRNIFISPFADGPIKFHITPEDKQNIETISRFGRSFSILRIPYSFKLLIQELQVMNVQMRIITEDNVDQIMNLSYSNDIVKLTNFTQEELDLINKNNSLEDKLNLVSKKYMSGIVSKLNKDEVKNKKAEQILNDLDADNKNMEVNNEFLDGSQIMTVQQITEENQNNQEFDVPMSPNYPPPSPTSPPEFIPSTLLIT